VSHRAADRARAAPSVRYHRTMSRIALLVRSRAPRMYSMPCFSSVAMVSALIMPRSATTQARVALDGLLAHEHARIITPTGRNESSNISIITALFSTTHFRAPNPECGISIAHISVSRVRHSFRQHCPSRPTTCTRSANAPLVAIILRGFASSRRGSLAQSRLECAGGSPAYLKEQHPTLL